MGVVLYKIGKKHTINGWECDKQIFDPEYLNLDARLAQGWHLTPDCGRTKNEPKIVEVYDGLQEQEQIEAEKAEKPQEEITKNYLDSLKWNELRRLAKKIGVSCAKKDRDQITSAVIAVYDGVT